MIHQTTSDNPGRYEQLTSEQARLVASLYSEQALEYYLHLCPARGGIRISLWRVCVENLRIKREILYSYLLPERKALLSNPAFDLLWLQLLADADAQSAPAVPAPDADAQSGAVVAGLSVEEFVWLRGAGVLDDYHAWAWVDLMGDVRFVRLAGYYLSYKPGQRSVQIVVGRKRKYKSQIDASKIESIELWHKERTPQRDFRNPPAVRVSQKDMPVYRANTPKHVGIVPIAEFMKRGGKGFVEYKSSRGYHYAQIIELQQVGQEYRAVIRAERTNKMLRYYSADKPVLVA